MFGLHIIGFPSGTFGFVGSVPKTFSYETTPTKEDIMAGRVYEKPDGAVVSYRFPTFPTANDAVAFVESIYRTATFEPEGSGFKVTLS